MHSPNYDERKLPVSMLVLHYTGMKSAQEALARLCDPASKVSAHYMIEEDGKVHALVDEPKRAWHAGVSAWCGVTDVNSASIGIELVNPGHEFDYRGFPEAQMEALATLCRDILSRHDIPARNVVAHSDVAPLRKKDPGELFDWQWLASRGVGVWPKEGLKTHGQKPELERLKTYGYEVPAGADKESIKKIIIAFQMHFRQSRLSGAWDPECNALLDRLLEIA